MAIDSNSNHRAQSCVVTCMQEGVGERGEVESVQRMLITIFFICD